MNRSNWKPRSSFRHPVHDDLSNDVVPRMAIRLLWRLASIVSIVRIGRGRVSRLLRPKQTVILDLNDDCLQLIMDEVLPNLLELHLLVPLSMTCRRIRQLALPRLFSSIRYNRFDDHRAPLSLDTARIIREFCVDELPIPEPRAWRFITRTIKHASGLTCFCWEVPHDPPPELLQTLITLSSLSTLEYTRYGFDWTSLPVAPGTSSTLSHLTFTEKDAKSLRPVLNHLKPAIASFFEVVSHHLKSLRLSGAFPFMDLIADLRWPTLESFSLTDAQPNHPIFPLACTVGHMPVISRLRLAVRPFRPKSMTWHTRESLLDENTTGSQKGSHTFTLRDALSTLKSLTLFDVTPQEEIWLGLPVDLEDLTVLSHEGWSEPGKPGFRPGLHALSESRALSLVSTLATQTPGLRRFRIHLDNPSSPSLIGAIGRALVEIECLAITTHPPFVRHSVAMINYLNAAASMRHLRSLHLALPLTSSKNIRPITLYEEIPLPSQLEELRGYALQFSHCIPTLEEVAFFENWSAWNGGWDWFQFRVTQSEDSIRVDSGRLRQDLRPVLHDSEGEHLHFLEHLGGPDHSLAGREPRPHSFPSRPWIAYS